MYPGRPYNFHSSQLPWDASTSMHGQPDCNTPPISQYIHPCDQAYRSKQVLLEQYVDYFASLPTAVDDFSYRSMTARHLLQEYFTYFSSLNKGSYTTPNRHANLIDILSEVSNDYVAHLKSITCNSPMDARKTNDDILLKLLWSQFRDEVSKCIGIMENTPIWMRSGLGAGFLIPELIPQMKEHIDMLQKVDASFMAFKSAEKTNTILRVSVEHRRLAFQAAAKARHARNQRARVPARVMVHAETQTYNRHTAATQTPTVPQMNRRTQTQALIKIAADHCVTQSTSTRPDTASQSTQTGNVVTRNAQTETPGSQGVRQKFKNKNVGTIAVKRIDASVQTYSKDTQVVNHWWRTVGDEVDNVIRQIMAPESWKAGAESSMDVDKIASELAQHISGAFFLLQTGCEGFNNLLQNPSEEIDKTHEKNELWSTFADYFLPCMEKARAARSQLYAMLFLDEHLDQNLHKTEAIKTIIGVLEMGLLLVRPSNEWLQHFKWTRDKGKKSAMERLQSFSTSDPVLNNFQAFQYRLGKFANEVSVPMPVPDPHESQEGALDMRLVQAALDQMAAIEYLECLSVQQHELINDYILKIGLFKNASKADLQNFVLHIWLPAVATVKLLSQKKWSVSAGDDVDNKLKCRANTFLRNSRWALGRICSNEPSDSVIIDDPEKKKLVEAFAKIAQPESLGLFNDAALVQDLLEHKINEMHKVFLDAKHDWIVDNLPFSLFIRCADGDDFTLQILEEWSALVATIRRELNTILRNKDRNTDEVESYVASLKKAQSFYQQSIRKGVSAKDEEKNLVYANSRSNTRVGVVDSLFGPEVSNPKARKVSEDLAKNLGLRSR